MEKARRASHAGSWYTDNPRKLSEELEGWLRESGLTKSPDVRGVIAPHAGYSYSGRAAAYAFGNIDPTNITRVFLLGPSHHYYTPKCALSTATVYKTPIGDLTIDLEVIEELKATGKFELMDIRIDEAEHSMEMHLPYLAKVFEGHQVKVVPILVGALKAESEAMYGQLLGKYVDDPQNFFSVSSDFCHWGSRFNYTHYDKKHGAIHKSIEALDRMGMDIIETGNPDAFKEYLLKFDNTICGRHPISVFLHMMKNCSTSIKINFLRYEQSSQCRTMRDSSVSYASAAAKVGATGKALKDVIAVGIGGSFLGHLQTASGSIRWANKSKSKTPREMQDNTVAVEEEKPSSSAKKLLNHWLRFSSGTLGEQRG